MPSLAMSWASLQGGNPITTLAKKIYSVHSDFKPCFSHAQELRLSSDYLFLLRAQSSFDLVSAERITYFKEYFQERETPTTKFFFRYFSFTSSLQHPSPPFLTYFPTSARGSSSSYCHGYFRSYRWLLSKNKRGASHDLEQYFSNIVYTIYQLPSYFMCIVTSITLISMCILPF